MLVYNTLRDVEPYEPPTIIIPGKDCEHEYKDGKCWRCGDYCEHEYKGSKCIKCYTNCEHVLIENKCNICGKLVYLGALPEETLIITTPTGELISGQSYIVQESSTYLFTHNLGKEFNINFDYSYEITGSVDLLMYRYENNVKVAEFTKPKTLDVSKFTNTADIGFADSDIKYETTNLLRFVEPKTYFTCGYLVNSSQFGIWFNNLTNNVFNSEDGTENYNGFTNPENGVKAVLVGYDLTIRLTFTEVVSADFNWIS